MSAQELPNSPPKEDTSPKDPSVFTFNTSSIAAAHEEEDYSQYFDDLPLPSQPQNSVQSKSSTDYDEVIGESTILPEKSTILPILNDFIEFIKYAGFSFTLHWNENGQPQSYRHECTASPIPQDQLGKLAEEERTTQENFLNFIDEAITKYNVRQTCNTINFACYANRDGIEVEYAPQYAQAADDNSVFSETPDEANMPSATGFATEKLGAESDIEDVL